MFLLFDIGASKMRVGCSKDGIGLGDFVIVDTPESFEEGISVIARCAREVTKGEKIEAVAGGVAGPMNLERTGLAGAGNLPDWAWKPLEEKIHQLFGCKVFIENDTAIVGLGEAVVGSGRGSDIVAYVTISTGVGAVRIVKGTIDHSAQGFEPGHQIIETRDGLPCSCGKIGHLEGYISGRALQKRYGKKPIEITDPAVWDQVCRYTAVGLNNIIVHWSPTVVVLGGSMMKEHGISMELVDKYTREMMSIFPQVPEIRLGMLGEVGGLHGALVYLRERMGLK
jgi:glucokinase